MSFGIICLQSGIHADTLRAAQAAGALLRAERPDR